MLKTVFSRRLTLSVLSLFAANALSAQSTGSLNLSKPVVIGDSLSAGFQNFSLLETQQVNGYANLIATQARVPLVMPRVPYPGIPPVLQLLGPGFPPVIAPVPVPPPAIPRSNPLEQPTALAVPTMTVAEALTKRPGPTADPYTNTILGFPTPFAIPGPARSQVEQALALNPTAAIVWLGSNDALIPVLFGDMSLLTPVLSFAASYEAVVTALKPSNARLILANIPDVTEVPYLTPVRTVAEQTGVPLLVLMAKLGVGPFDYLRPTALPLVQQILTGAIAGPLPAVCPVSLGLPVPAVPCVMRAADALTLKSTVLAYNAVIARIARANNAVLVDIHSLLERLASHGVVIDGQRLTTDFLGGIFSLDGIHPTNTAYALIANEFIHEMNRQAGASIPPVNVLQVKQSDPLVLPGQGHPPSR